MWLSEQMKRAAPTTDVSLGVTTIEGEGAGVLARGEARDLPIYGPGGYVWLPAGGEDVLVIRGGPGGTERCVGGSRQSAAPEGMQPG
ncbi:MAG: hypothetical protein IKN53_04755, partial [Oscillibacter sp.]|nr:hypothetical protein [Oscillibacter sp.]